MKLTQIILIWTTCAFMWFSMGIAVITSSFIAIPLLLGATLLTIFNIRTHYKRELLIKEQSNLLDQASHIINELQELNTKLVYMNIAEIKSNTPDEHKS